MLRKSKWRAARSDKRPESLFSGKLEIIERTALAGVSRVDAIG